MAIFFTIAIILDLRCRRFDKHIAIAPYVFSLYQINYSLIIFNTSNSKCVDCRGYVWC